MRVIRHARFRTETLQWFDNIFIICPRRHRLLAIIEDALKGKKKNGRKERGLVCKFSIGIVIRHSTEWFTQRGETRQCVFIRTQILRTSTFCIPSTMLGWYFYSTLLAATEVGHHRERVKSADGYANFSIEIVAPLTKSFAKTHTQILLSSTFHRQCLDNIFTVHSS